MRRVSVFVQCCLRLLQAILDWPDAMQLWSALDNQRCQTNQPGTTIFAASAGCYKFSGVCSWVQMAIPRGPLPAAQVLPPDGHLSLRQDCCGFLRREPALQPVQERGHLHRDNLAQDSREAGRHLGATGRDPRSSTHYRGRGCLRLLLAVAPLPYAPAHYKVLQYLSIRFAIALVVLQSFMVPRSTHRRCSANSSACRNAWLSSWDASAGLKQRQAASCCLLCS